MRRSAGRCVGGGWEDREVIHSRARVPERPWRAPPQPRAARARGTRSSARTPPTPWPAAADGAGLQSCAASRRSSRRTARRAARAGGTPGYHRRSRSVGIFTSRNSSRCVAHRHRCRHCRRRCPRAPHAAGWAGLTVLVRSCSCRAALLRRAPCTRAGPAARWLHCSYHGRIRH